MFRAAGLDVDLVLDGSTDGLPAGVDLSVYRIVQEGLTNVLKHAPGTAVQVGYHRRPDGVDVDLRSGRGRSDSLDLASTGRGLVGMRERVAVFGGDLDAAMTDDGGYVVRARLPLVRPACGHVVTTVVLADDQELIRVGLRVMLEAGGIDVVAEAGDGRAAVRACRKHRPDVVLMDIRMPVLDGIAATAEIAEAELRRGCWC